METYVDGKKIFDGRIFKVHVDTVRVEKTGKLATREMVKHNGGVCVIASENHKILLVKQYRYVIGEETLEIPAGKLEVGEDPMHSAAREIEEETGYRATSLEPICHAYATPGYDTEMLHIYKAIGLTRPDHPLEADEDEDISYDWYDLDTCLTWIKEGKIKDAKTVIGIYEAILSETIA